MGYAGGPRTIADPLETKLLGSYVYGSFHDHIMVHMEGKK
jgi:hypothetical protein